jgi:hypothetical protein
VYTLCRYLVRTGCQVRVLTTNANGPDAVLNVPTDRDVLLDGVSVRYCPRFGAENTSIDLLRRLPSAIAWADVVHLTAVYSFPTIPVLALARMARKPVVWSPRGSLQRWQGSTNLRAKMVWERLCTLFAPQYLTLHVTSAEEAEERGAGSGELRRPSFRTASKSRPSSRMNRAAANCASFTWGAFIKKRASKIFSKPAEHF